jgi:hypothetical protein
MLAHFTHITSKSDPSYDGVNAISTCSSKTFIATASKDISSFVPTLHERFKVNIWSEKREFLETKHFVCLARTANTKGEIRHSGLYTEITGRCSKELGRTKIIYVHS